MPNEDQAYASARAYRREREHRAAADQAVEDFRTKWTRCPDKSVMDEMLDARMRASGEGFAARVHKAARDPEWLARVDDAPEDDEVR